MSEEKVTRGRKKAEAVDNTKVVNDAVSEELAKEREKNSQMESMLKQLQEQMMIMQSQLLSQNNGGNQVVINQNDNMTRTVKVISLLSHKYVLPIGSQNGLNGKVYRFKKFGDVQNIRFTDMIDLVAKFGHQFEKGYAVLESKKDYDDLGIGYVWDMVTSFDEISKIVELNREEDVDFILNLNEEMRENIANLIAIRIADGHSYDYNKIKELEDEGLVISEVAELVKASKEEK